MCDIVDERLRKRGATELKRDPSRGGGFGVRVSSPSQFTVGAWALYQHRINAKPFVNGVHSVLSCSKKILYLGVYGVSKVTSCFHHIPTMLRGKPILHPPITYRIKSKTYESHIIFSH